MLSPIGFLSTAFLRHGGADASPAPEPPVYLQS